MSQIKLSRNTIQIDADVLAKVFRISPDELKLGMRDGTITSRSEHGEGEDAGNIRLTFFSAKRRVRIIADEKGNILTCSGVDLLPRTAGTPPAGNPAGKTTTARVDTAADKARLDGLLDVALEGTFPASDPVAVSFDKVEVESPLFASSDKE